MTDKVQKIRAEIKRRMLEDYNSDNEEQDVIAQGVCAGILYFIDSLQEKPVSRTPADIEAAMQEVEEKSRAFTDAHHGEVADTILAQMRGEEPVSEDLEYASEKYACKFSSSKYGHDKIKATFIAGAQWHKQQMMSKTIDGEVGYWNQRGLSVLMSLPSEFEENDKCKIILIKED